MRRLFFICSLCLLFLVGCNSKDDANNGTSKKEKAEIRIRTIEKIDSVGLINLINHRNGKLLLLNIWATWCQPCVEEFPDLIKISQDNSFVEVVGISVDYTDEISAKVLPFIKKLNVPFKIYVAKFDKQEDFISLIDSDWSGAIPATIIYDSKGIKRSVLIGKKYYTQFKNEIESISLTDRDQR